MSLTTDIHRRDFLALAAAGCSAGGLAASTPGRAADVDGRDVHPNAAGFARSLGTPFRIRGSSGVESVVVLDRVEERAGSPNRPSEARVPFTLTFRARGGRPLPQDVYRVDHPTLGRSHLLLVPVGPPRAEATLEAVFG